VNTLGCHFLALREIEQLAQGVFRAFGLYTGYAEIVAATADLYVESRLEQAQILIQRAAQIREPGIVRWLEIEFAQGGRS
jgi:hypothetical protein